MVEVSFNIRAVALILREQNGMKELLAQSFEANPSIPWRFPGAGIEEGQSIEDGILREVREESGIEKLDFIRELGVQRHYKAYLGRFMERHDFLFTTIDELPDFWKNTVHGNGNDAGEVFHFQ